LLGGQHSVADWVPDASAALGPRPFWDPPIEPPDQLGGLVYDAPDEQAAIAKAIEQSACKLSNPGYNTSRLVSLNENLMDACRPPPMCESRGDTG
jgi:hypothetical protein